MITHTALVEAGQKLYELRKLDETVTLEEENDRRAGKVEGLKVGLLIHCISGDVSAPIDHRPLLQPFCDIRIETFDETQP